MKESRYEWQRSGAYQVAPGVFRIPLPMPSDGLRAINVYAIEDGAGLTLIDAGWAMPLSRRALNRALAEIGWRAGDIRRVLVTHHHRDHYSQAVALRREFATEVMIGAGEQATLADVERYPVHIGAGMAQLLVEAGAQQLLEEVRMVSAGLEPVDPADWAPADRWLFGDEVLDLHDRQLTVVPTPGHTRGHVVYHDAAAKLIFAGDHVLPHITPSIGFESLPAISPLADYLSSLDLVARLGANRLLPAHGPVRASTTERIEELVLHHRDRLQATLRAVGSGPSTVGQVAERLRWTRRGTRFDALDPNSRMTAVIETHAHLRLLVERGELRTENRGTVERYTPKVAVLQSM